MSTKGSILGNSVLQGSVVQQISIIGTPTRTTDAVNKGYVDDLMTATVNGYTYKTPVRAVTIALLNATYNQPNLSNGLNATLTATGVGALTIDSVAVNNGDRVLVKDQLVTTQNGIYTVTSKGSPSTTFVLTRATDADNVNPDRELVPGTLVFANEGTVNKNYSFLITSPSSGDITIGTTGIVWSQYNSNIYSAGSNLSLSGSTFSLNNNLSGLGTVAATSLTLTNPLPIAQGGCGTASISSGYVKSNGTALSSVNSIPSTDVTGLGTLASASTVDLLTSVTNALPIANGGTASTTASGARSSLGLGTLATQSSASLTSDVTGILPLANGGSGVSSLSSGYVKSTGSAMTSVSTIPSSDITGLGSYCLGTNNLSELTNASTARTALGLGTSATHNVGDFLQVSNNLSDVTAATARTNLGLGTVATHAATEFLQASNNLSDVASASSARTSLGLGTMATQSSSNVSITGGSMVGTTSFDCKADTSGSGNLHYTLRTATPTLRFGMGLTGTESSSNAGSNFALYRYADNGDFLGTGIFIQRSNGHVGFNDTSVVCPLTVVVPSSQSAFHFGSSSSSGGYLTSVNPQQAIVTGGTRWTGSSWVNTGAAGGGYFEIVGPTMSWQTVAAGTDGAAASFSNRMSINSNGKLQLTGGTRDAICCEQTTAVSTQPRILTGEVVMTTAAKSSTDLGNGYTAALISSTQGRMRITFTNAFNDYTVNLQVKLGVAGCVLTRIEDQQSTHFDFQSYLGDLTVTGDVSGTAIKVHFQVIGY